MGKKILGPEGSRRRYRWRLLSLVGVLALALFVINGAQAVHDLGLFELDTTTVANPTPPPATNPIGDANVKDQGKTGSQGGDDWDKVFCSAPGAPSGAPCTTIGTVSSGNIGTSFSTDGTSPAQAGDPLDVSYFTGGSTKDVRDIGSNGA